MEDSGQQKKVILVSPRGFCAGVRSAIEIFNRAAEEHPGTIYVLNELVHNLRVGEDMRARGAVFVSSLAEVPRKSTVLFGAHGVGKQVELLALQRELNVVDAGCPRVKLLHRKAAALGPEDELVIFGNPEHPEIRGVAGHSGTDNVFIINHIDGIRELPDLKNPCLLCQTTRDHFEIEKFTSALKARFPLLRADSGVCDAVYKRQLAVEQLIGQVDVMIIAGSPHSSNANRMCDVAQRSGKPAFLIDNADQLPDLSGFCSVGLGAGASTPEESVSEILERLISCGFKLEKN